MAIQTTSEILNPRDIRIDMSINPREAIGSADSSYDVKGMRLQIEDTGYLKTPPGVERLPDGSLRVLDGFQRMLAIEDILNDPNAKQSLKDVLAEIRCTVYEGLTSDERDAIVLNHGEQHPLTRIEVIKMIWKHYQTMDFARLCVRFWQAMLPLSNAADREKLQNDMKTLVSDVERKNRLTTFFRGTVNDYILGGLLLGPRVQTAIIETEAGRKPEFKTSRKAIGDLTAAMNRDLSKNGRKADGKAYEEWNADFDGKGWTQKDGGNNFNAVLKRLIDKTNGVVDPNAAPEITPLSAKELGNKATMAKSKAARVAFKIARGAELDATEQDFLAIDQNNEAMESIQSFTISKIKEIETTQSAPVVALLKAIAYPNGSSADFELALSALLNPVKAEATMAEAEASAAEDTASDVHEPTKSRKGKKNGSK